MRGKVRYVPAGNAYSRITPAYAGKSNIMVSNSSFSKDHPRLCGEKSDMLEKITWNLGSPPPMRGKEDTRKNQRFIKRITPAYAGKSLAEFNSISFNRDHPRLCGEKFDVSQNFYMSVGSPPPMRGKAHGSICHL